MGYVEELRSLVGHRPLILVAGVALIFDERERLLLIERADDGHWGVTGGLMEPGETLEETTRREVREEVGLELGELRSLGLFSGPSFHHVYPNGDESFGVTMASVARYDGAELRLDPAEVLDARFFALDGLPAKLRSTVPIYVSRYLENGRRG